MADFLDMGGYANFVWPAYAATAAALIGLTAYVLRRNASARKELVRIEARIDDQRPRPRD